MEPLDRQLTLQRADSGDLAVRMIDEVEPAFDWYAQGLAEIAGEAEPWKAETDLLGVRWLIAKAPDALGLYDDEHMGSHITGMGLLKGYNPLQLKTLHREFAELPVTEEAIGAFAARYGFLGEIWELRPEPAVWDAVWEEMNASKKWRNWWGESFIDWGARITYMKALVHLYDLYRVPATADPYSHPIVELCSYDHDDCWFRREYVESLGPLAPNDLGSYAFFDYNPTSPEPMYHQVARCLLRAHLSELLNDNTSVDVDVVPGSQLTLVPTCLWGAICVLLMQEVMGQSAPFVRCAGCGKWKPPGASAKRRYCSSACKQKAYRATKGKAPEG